MWRTYIERIIENQRVSNFCYFVEGEVENHTWVWSGMEKAPLHKQDNSNQMLGASGVGVVVKLALGMPHPILLYLDSGPCSAPDCSFLPVHTLRESSAGLRSWVPGSQLQPDLALNCWRHLRAESANEISLSVSLCFSAFLNETNKPR